MSFLDDGFHCIQVKDDAFLRDMALFYLSMDLSCNSSMISLSFQFQILSLALANTSSLPGQRG